MKSKIKKIVVSFFFAVLCVLAGFLIGNYSQGGETVETVVTEQTPVVSEPEPKINFKDTIAIVNLDEGLNQGGNIINYGNSLVSALDRDVRVTGLQDARNGIENGTYSAYVVIPTTFSKNIMTINEKPMSSEITYAIAAGLEGQNRDETIGGVYSIYNSFCNDITQIYTATILDEYHNAQDVANTIMANDTKDMNTLLEIQGYNLVEITTIPELKQVENKVTDLDLSAYMGMYEEQIATIQNLYSEYSNGVQTRLSALLDLANVVNSSTIQWDSEEELENQDGQTGISNEMNKIVVAHSDYVTEKNLTDELLTQAQINEFAEYDNNIENMKEKISAYDTELATYIESELMRYKYLETSYNNIIECLEDFKSKDEVKESEIDLDGSKISVNEYTYEFYTKEQFNKYKQECDTNANATIGNSIKEYENSVKSRLIDVLTDMEDSVKDNYNASILGTYGSVEECVEAILEGSWSGVGGTPIEPPTENPTEEPTELPTEEPTQEPTESPTEEPTEEPTEAPTEEPTESPTEEPTEAPTEEPTEAPTEAPIEISTEEPTEEPTEVPIEPLTNAVAEVSNSSMLNGAGLPVKTSAESPTEEPTESPTEEPTESPTEAPTEEPTETPTEAPTEEPTETPTEPSIEPGTSLTKGNEMEPAKFKVTVFEDIIEFNMNNKPLLNSEELVDDLVESAKSRSTEKTDIIKTELGYVESVLKQYERAESFYLDLKTGLNEWADNSTTVIQAEKVPQVQSNLSVMSSTTSRIVSAVKIHDTEYKTYTTEVYSLTEKNISTLKEYIVQSQQLSEAKVLEGLDIAKQSREMNNQINISLLKNLTTRLPYTRLGNVENREVYTFMARPITLFDISEPIENVEQKPIETIQVTTVTTTVNESNQADSNFIWLIAGFVVLLVISGIVSAVIGMKKPTEDF